jgi:hypothetical protein
MFQLRMVTVGAVGCLAFLTGACGGSSTPAVARDASVTLAPPGPPATDLPTDLMLTSSPSAVPTGGAQPAGTATASASPSSKSIIPANFPFPDGSTHTVSTDKPTDASMTVRGVTPAAAVAFYQKALPGVGYKLFQQSTSDGRNKVTFSGHSQSIEILAGGTRTPDLILIVFTQCTSGVQGSSLPTRRSDRVACQ